MVFHTAAINHLRTHSALESSIEAYTTATTSQPSLSVTARRSLLTSHLPSDTPPLFFSWDIPRTREGHYHYRSGLAAATKRAKAYAPSADLLWLETGDPSVSTAASIASDIHASHPGKWLVYNLSPSFNWSAHGFSDDALASFIPDLAKEGFVLQLVSLAGLHVSGVGMWELSRRFGEEGMKVYVQVVQRRERESGCDVLTHQKWSGAGYVDGMVGAVVSGSSGSRSMGEGSTEGQF